MGILVNEEIELSGINLERVILDQDQIRELLPHRHEMLQLDGIILTDVPNKHFVGFRDISEGEFWARGHFPGNPMFPGVLMVEAAAQLSVVAYKTIYPEHRDRLLAFGAIDDVKFRGVVRPGDRVILSCKGTGISPRACKGMVWGYVGGKKVFEARVLGLPIRQ